MNTRLAILWPRHSVSRRAYFELFKATSASHHHRRGEHLRRPNVSYTVLRLA
jgi:hypothetical protein